MSGGNTKQKDSFLSMFADEADTRSNDKPKKGKNEVNVNVTKTPPPAPQQPARPNTFQNNSYGGPSYAAPINNNPDPAFQQQNEEPQEEGQLNIDVYQTEEDIVIKSAISGVKAEDLDINIQNDMVTIRGTRRPADNVDPEDYYYQECFWGTFSRAVILPVDVDPENVRAELEDGILTINLPKAEKMKTRKIEVVEKR